MIETKIFGGGFVNIKISDMLNGYESDVAAKINGGDYYQGNDFSLSSLATPIRNEIQGLQADVPYGVYTGSNGVDEIGRLRIINEEAYTNRLYALWNGTAMVNTTLTDSTLSTSEKELDGVSAGMQFPPDIQEDDQLRLYDQRNLKIMTYNHD